MVDNASKQGSDHSRLGWLVSPYYAVRIWTRLAQSKLLT